MSFAWYSLSDPVAIWWTLLLFISASNVIWWCSIARYAWLSGKTKNVRVKVMLVLSSLYTFVCAFRSIFPRIDLPRISLFPGWYSSVPVGRGLATIAEIAFSLQWAIMLNYLGRVSNDRYSRRVAYFIVPLIVCAEICSWYAVVTENSLWNAFENSIWGIAFVLIATSLLSLRQHFERPVRRFMDIVFIGLLGYILFLATIDVPMYVQRWLIQEGSGAHFHTFAEGLQHLFDPWLVSTSPADWVADMPWILLYFSFGVWSSLLLCLGSVFEERLSARVTKDYT